MSNVKLASYTERDNVGVSLHTALRKLCDSKESSRAWRAFSDMPPKLWSQYCDAVWAAVQQNVSVESVRKSTLDFLGKSSHPTALEALAALETFDEVGWEAYCGYLFDIS